MTQIKLVIFYTLIIHFLYIPSQFVDIFGIFAGLLIYAATYLGLVFFGLLLICIRYEQQTGKIHPLLIQEMIGKTYE